MKFFDGTTVIAVRKNGKTAMAGDGQVTFGNTIMKASARKVRSIYDGRILVGFAGATADAFTLFERFEIKVREYSGDITRASVELAKDWRTDKVLRQLEAMLVIGDKEKLLLLTGTGDVVEPDEGVTAIGSGGPYAYAAALAYVESDSYSAREVAEKAMKIAAKICIYTNENFVIEELT
jgi:ATP-dependent HslUV protease, peptidase subunit HslV